MFLDNLRNGPKYLTFHAEEAKKLDFGDYIKIELGKPDIGFKSAAFMFLILIFVVMIMSTPAFIYLIDFLGFFYLPQTYNQFIQTTPLAIQLVYFTRLGFSLITEIILLFIALGLFRQFFNPYLPSSLRIDLKPDLRYFLSFYEFLQQEDPEKAAKVVQFDTKSEDYYLNCYYSFLDPLKVFNAFERKRFRNDFLLLIGSVWVLFTGFIGFFSLLNGWVMFVTIPVSILNDTPVFATDLANIFLLSQLLFAIGAFCTLLITISQMGGRTLRFQRFVQEIRDRLEEYVNYLLIQYEQTPTFENGFLLEKEQTNLKKIEDYVGMPLKLSLRVLAILFPFLSALFTVLTSLSSVLFV